MTQFTNKKSFNSLQDEYNFSISCLKLEKGGCNPNRGQPIQPRIKKTRDITKAHRALLFMLQAPISRRLNFKTFDIFHRVIRNVGANQLQPGKILHRNI